MAGGGGWGLKWQQEQLILVSAMAVHRPLRFEETHKWGNEREASARLGVERPESKGNNLREKSGM